jgi:TonB family protein
MSNSGPLPSRDVQDFPLAPPWQEPAFDQADDPGSTASLALAILSEKIKSGTLQRTELMERIVAQASAATGARGVALALRPHPSGRVVCCAAIGDMAPPEGTALDERSGFTAECLRNGVVLICDDSRTDARVDQAACARLGVRSIVAAPVADEGSIIGVLEALSDQPSVFSKQHIEILLTLACFAKSAITPTDDDVQPTSPADFVVTPDAAADPAPSLVQVAPREPGLRETNDDSRAWRVPRQVRLALVCGVAAAVLLALVATAVFVWMWGHRSAAEASKATPPRPQHPVVAKPPAAIATSVLLREPQAHKRDGQNERKPLIVKASPPESTSSPEPEAASANTRKLTPEADNEVAPAAITSLATEDNAELKSVLSSPGRLPSPVLATSQGFTPARLEHRVTPVYPPEAKRLRIEGPVVLRLTIDEQGKVASIGFMKGSPILARAAETAVRLWHYQPSELNHRATSSTTDVTIVFRLE